MARALILAVSALLLAPADVTTLFRFRPQPAPLAEFPAGESLPVMPELTQTPDSPPSNQAPQSDRLQEKSRMEILRQVSGEFARAVRPLPGGKKGIHLKVGQPFDENNLRSALASSGSAANPGDQVQITQIEFREKEIILDINGGGRQRTRWRDRIHLEVGGLPTARVEQTGPPGLQRVGSTIYLDFGQRVPDITPNQLKNYLSVFLDFAKQRSASVQWVDTLPPEFQQAIKDKRAAVGMDQEMVIAAVGRPDKKVRERDDDGMETEDWIYGHPPGKTVFVKFAGDKVISVKQFP